MTNVKRKEKESFEGFLRRFKQYLRNSKIIPKIRERTYLVDKPSRVMRKEQAIAREKIKNRNEYLRKIGKMTEDK